MEPFLTPDLTVPNSISPNGIVDQNDSVKPRAGNLAERMPEAENEVNNHKSVEKGAKLMRAIWGDRFQSDSLH